MVSEKEKEVLEEVDAAPVGETINVKNMLERFRKKAAGILGDRAENESDVELHEPEENKESAQEIKLDTLKVDTIEADTIKSDFIKTDEFKAENSEFREKTEPNTEIEEISIDIDDIKNEISDAVRKTMEKETARFSNIIPSGDSGTQDVKTELDSIRTELEAVKKRLQVIQLSTEEKLRDNGENTTSLHKSAADLRDRIGEISQTLNSVSKLSDSVFDLKNAQINMKKAIDTQDGLMNRIKKKINASTAILSVIGVLIIALQIIALLS